LAEKIIPANLFEVKKGEEPFRILIPFKTCQEVSRIMGEEEIIRVFHDENQVFFKTEKTELISRLIEGSFPDYSAIIPREFSIEITVSRDDLASAIKLTGVFGQKNSEVKIKIHPNKKAIEMSSADQSLGENSYTLPAKVKGEGSEACFNWRYLADPMKSIHSEDVFLGMQEDAGPALIRATDDSSYLYILRPILKS
jgi:DNA polymerase-3 subunit beta